MCYFMKSDHGGIPALVAVLYLWSLAVLDHLHEDVHEHRLDNGSIVYVHAMVARLRDARRARASALLPEPSGSPKKGKPRLRGAPAEDDPSKSWFETFINGHCWNSKIKTCDSTRRGPLPGKINVTRVTWCDHQKAETMRRANEYEERISCDGAEPPVEEYVAPEIAVPANARKLIRQEFQQQMTEAAVGFGGSGHRQIIADVWSCPESSDEAKKEETRLRLRCAAVWGDCFVGAKSLDQEDTWDVLQLRERLSKEIVVPPVAKQFSHGSLERRRVLDWIAKDECEIAKWWSDNWAKPRPWDRASVRSSIGEASDICAWHRLILSGLFLMISALREAAGKVKNRAVFDKLIRYVEELAILPAREYESLRTRITEERISENKDSHEYLQNICLEMKRKYDPAKQELQKVVAFFARLLAPPGRVRTSKQNMNDQLKSQLEQVEKNLGLPPLDEGKGEFYLWHGATKDVSMTILENGFRNPAHPSHETVRGNMFGRGAYFAECSSKCDEYTTKSSENQRCLVFSRVRLGEVAFRYEKSVDPLSENKKSLLGDREAFSGTYREFVVACEGAERERLASVFPLAVIEYEDGVGR